MDHYNITGMSCAACQSRVEKAVRAVEGVSDCAVSLLTNTMSVNGNADSSVVIAAVEKAGYGASLQGQSEKIGIKSEKKDKGNDEIAGLLKRLAFSLLFLIVLMYITMGHNMLGFPLPPYFVHNHLGLTLAQLLLSAAVLIINGRFFTNGFRSLVALNPNMDTLVALGSSVSFMWSIYIFFSMCKMITDGAANMALMDFYHNELYFESAAMIPALITVGKLLEAISKGKTTSALRGLIALKPKRARLIINGIEKNVDASEVKTGDIFVVKPGESIPADGTVTEGESAVDESALTGESIPVEKMTGDTVSASTINKSGYLKCIATRVGEDTTLSKIIKLVTDASATKAPIAKTADKVSGVFVPIVIVISIIVTVVWLIFGASLSDALARGISVLVISCPCALGLATPVAVMVGNGLGAKNGILIKTGEALETIGKIKTAVLDKTGTITRGAPEVTDIIPSEYSDRDELLRTAYSLERKSEHPLAAAVVRECERLNIDYDETDSFTALPGFGVKAEIGSDTIYGANIKNTRERILNSELFETGETKAQEGKTPLYFTKNDRLLGMICVADVIKESSPEAVKELKALGLKVVMLTGDNEKTAAYIADQSGVDETIANVMPDDKETVIRKLKKSGLTCMVGDGINDAPALTAADVGIAIGAGTDIAIDSADIVLMNSDLNDLTACVRLGRGTLRNIRENLFWAFFYNLICIPLAAGAFGLKLNPMYAAAAMSISSVTVCLNALRINLLNIRGNKNKKSKTDKYQNSNPKTSSVITTKEKGEIKSMTILTEGMMCPHCEASMKTALEELSFVETATADHKSGKVELEINGIAEENAIRQAVENRGYKYIRTIE